MIAFCGFRPLITLLLNFFSDFLGNEPCERFIVLCPNPNFGYIPRELRGNKPYLNFLNPAFNQAAVSLLRFSNFGNFNMEIHHGDSGHIPSFLKRAIKSFLEIRHSDFFLQLSNL